ncbi:uncharacterized protein with ParB-like and HNH nuclease domain [Bacillus sp. SORGH_AS 510]|uniref:DUF262 domain-containing protein n=1 Tax=Bacillus sp. SORGH_AS_0510 TaxID=3041771 RepID=UPI00278398C7|nr:DUF262 domain-containing protein [Bacillus sp. SORGH_AS_0510]MDQ1147028.1 uncharacterized protein with ParB-like and HNH nuclease domain [Bacillus sp. SORGH_AS_0510]
MTNTITMKTINDLLETAAFFIPSYQRGYRWDETQVKNLLNDILQFMKEGSSTFYCLQPIVVRKTSKYENGLPIYEVIDGQQRLTTISLILTYLNEVPYSLTYETRPNSFEYLKAIREEIENGTEAKNIDFHFFKKAFVTIQEWFEQPRENRRTLRQKFLIALGESVKVIWYEVSTGVEVREVFSRLNIGKIPLTNAELIKALILSKTPQNKQLEIANEWDQIERRLRHDRLWYFIQPKSTYTNRIELLFDIYTGNVAPKHHDPFYTFYKIQEETDFEHLWLQIKAYLARFEEWYDDRKLYHYLGYLTQQKSITKYIDLYDDDNIKDKRHFRTELLNEIKRDINGIKIEDLTYGQDSAQIKKILLLFNIVTTLNQKNNEARFPFDRYSNERWSIEHIHAQHTDGLNTKEQWLAWIQDAIYMLEQLDAVNEPEKYQQLIQKLLEHKNDKDITSDIFEQLFNQVLVETEEEFGSSIHDIDNLVLLDQATNSALSNHFYPIKYQRLIEYDKQGSFIPICTRNAFMKYYSKKVDNFQLWAEQDREDYLEAVQQTLKMFQ